jgi:hypothetical protein
MSITLPTFQQDYMTDLTNRARQLGSLGGGLGGLTGGLDRAFDPLKRVLRDQLTQSVVRDKIDPFVDEVKQMAQERFDLQEQPRMTIGNFGMGRYIQGGGAFASDGPQRLGGLAHAVMAPSTSVPERMAKGGPMVSGLGSFLSSNIDEFGRNGDTEMIHATREEVVMPKGMMDDPEVRETVREAFARSGRDMDEFTVGSGKMNVNPMTGYEEAFDLIGGIKDLFKKAAPVLLPAVVGSIFPGMNPFISGALAGGVGSLLQGGDTRDVLKDAFIGGTSSAIFKGLTSGNMRSGFQTPENASYKPVFKPLGEKAGKVQNFFMTEGTKGVSASEAAKNLVTEGLNPNSANFDKLVAMEMQKPTAAKLDYMKAIPAGIGALALAGGFDEIEEEAPEDFYEYTSRELVDMFPEKYRTGPIIAPRSKSLEEKLNERFYAAKGGSAEFPRKNGAIAGPGTGTSDDIPAMLSDGEFVMTAKAVRGAGEGSREKGVQNMYNMMRAFEGGAVA